MAATNAMMGELYSYEHLPPKEKKSRFLYIFNFTSFDIFKDYHDSLPSISFCDLILLMLRKKKQKKPTTTTKK